MKKETFIQNISKMKKGMTQKELAEIAGCATGTMSKYLNPTLPDFPDVDGLIKLSQHFHVSIDWLVGNDNIISRQFLSPRDVCEMLLKIYNSDCAFGLYEANNEDRPLTHLEVRFNGWYCSGSGSDFSGIQAKPQEEIARFLSRLLDVSNMFDKGNLSQEMYDILVQHYLNDVSDEIDERFLRPRIKKNIREDMLSSKSVYSAVDVKHEQVVE